MRTIETIDAELRVLAAYRSACVGAGSAVRSIAALDELLDERIRGRCAQSDRTNDAT